MRKNSLRLGLVIPGVTGMFFLLQSLNLGTIDGAEPIKASPAQQSATFTIAASNSLPQSKARADYVCDGIDDNVEIQKAIDALPDTEPKGPKGTGGGSIQLLEGTFNIGDTIRFYDKTVSLIGAGMYSTVLRLQKGVNDDMFLIGTGK